MLKFTNSYMSDQSLDAIVKEVGELIKSENFIGGDIIRDLEIAISYISSPTSYSVTCGNGTDALVAALEYFRKGRRQIVFCPAYTFVATVEAIVLAGFEPWFVDINPGSLTICARSLRENIIFALDQGHEIAGVVAVDIFGNPCEYLDLRNVCLEYGAFLISDAAQALGVKYHGMCISKFVDVMTTSFYPTKPLGGLGDGGAIISQDPNVINFARNILQHRSNTNLNDIMCVGRNSRLDTINAYFLLSKIGAFEKELKERRRTASFIEEHSSDRAILQRKNESGLSSWCNLSFQLGSADKAKKALVDLKRIGVEARQYYQPLACDINGFRSFNQDINGLSVSHEAAKTVVSLPCHGLETAAVGEHLLQALSFVGFIRT